jgi:hypothetical protein
MPLTQPKKPFQVKPMPGMHARLEDLDQGDKFVQIAQNCRFEPEIGTVQKKAPATYYNEVSLGADPIRSIYRYYNSGGDQLSIITDGSVARVGDDSDGTFDTIRTGLTEGKRHSFVVYQDLLIAGNGFDATWCFDGSDNVTWELGACKAALQLDAGGVVDAGTHSYRVVDTVAAVDLIF